MRPPVQRTSSFFRGSELPRLLFLAAITIVGWTLVWNYATNLNQAGEQELKVAGKPEPLVADQSIEFETVTDRTPMGFRDNAAYSLLLERAAGVRPERSPPLRAATSCSPTSGKPPSSTAACRSTFLAAP